MGYEVLTSGYVSMDRIIRVLTPPRAGMTSLVSNADHDRIQYGGCSVNIAAALCRLGKRTAPVIRVGDDFERTGFRGFLEEMKIPTEGVGRVPGETTSACYLIQDPNHDHITIFYPGAMDKKYARELPDSLFAGTRLGVITVAAKEDNRIFLDKLKKHGAAAAFGMKDDFDAFPKDFLWELLTESRIIFTNEVEADMICRLFGLTAVSELLARGKAQYVVTTLGENGSVCLEKKGDGIAEYRVGICRTPNVVDATGSGDAYMSGFLYGWLEGRPPRECCCLGAALASFVIQKEGCCTNLPDIRALEEKAREL